MAVVRGARLAYRERGQGEPVVFVHGSLSDMRMWEQQLPRVGASYRAIAYSRRYARPNEDIAPGIDDPLSVHVDDLIAFLRAIDAFPAHLVGSSFGAFVCLVTAMRAPDLVASVVLQEPPVLSLFVSTPPRPAELFRLFVRRPRLALAIVGFGATAAGPAQSAFRRGDDDRAMQLFLHGALGKDAYGRLPDLRKQQFRDNIRALEAQLLGAGFPPLRDDDIRGVRTKALLMTGEHSPRVFLRMTDRLEELMPNAERVSIASASHLMAEENAAAVNEAILGFLGRRGPTS